MNTNLFAIVKQIVAEQGEDILSEPRRVTAFFADLAKDEPKPQKYAFVKCLEYKSAQLLKNAAEPDREACKQQLAQKLHDEEGLDLELCKESLELLTKVLFEKEPVALPEKEKLTIHCKNCGKELQEEWKGCPYCLTPTTKTSQVTSPTISSGSDSGEQGNGVGLSEPVNSQAANGSTWMWGFFIVAITIIILLFFLRFGI
jgi:hypothetical protein